VLLGHGDFAAGCAPLRPRPPRCSWDARPRVWRRQQQQQQQQQQQPPSLRPATCCAPLVRRFERGQWLKRIARGPKFYFGRGRAGLGSERWGTVRRPSPVFARRGWEHALAAGSDLLRRAGREADAVALLARARAGGAALNAVLYSHALQAALQARPPPGPACARCLGAASPATAERGG